MASSYSTDLKLELMVTGENAGQWGDNTNNNLNLIQQAIAGYEAIALTDGGTVPLAMTDKTISNARNMVIKFTGTLTTASTVTIPDTIEKFYIFDCSAVVAPTNLTIKTASGTGFTLDRAGIFAAYTDGTNLNEISLDTLGGTVAAAKVTPAGSDTQIQFNDGGALGASSNLTWDDTNLTIGSAAGAIKLTDSDQSHNVALKAGAMSACATFVLPTTDGTTGQALTTDGSGNLSFADVGGGINWDTTPKTTTFTAVAGNGYFVDTTSGAIALDLPSSPSAGDTVAIADYAGTASQNAITVQRNGSNLEGQAVKNSVLRIDREVITYFYVDATQGWVGVSDLSTSIIDAQYVSASGGTLYTTPCNQYKIHVFNSPGTLSILCGGNACGSSSIDFMVAAGGGKGGTNRGGGAGGGGFRESCGSVSGCYTTSPLSIPCSAQPVTTAQSIPITVGAGSTTCMTAGGPSVILCYTSAGGGAGGSVQNGQPGGSGGGAGHPNKTGGSGNSPGTSPPQGNPGYPSDNSGGGGGGGATQAGGPGTGGPYRTGGAGAGTTIDDGNAGGQPSGGVWYFSGGGGGNPGGASGLGGSISYSGGGGRSTCATSPNSGQSGGDGVVVVRYKYR